MAHLPEMLREICCHRHLQVCGAGAGGGVDRGHKGTLFLVGLFSSGGARKGKCNCGGRHDTVSSTNSQLENYTQKRHGRKLGFSVRVVDTIADQRLGYARKGKRWRILQKDSFSIHHEGRGWPVCGGTYPKSQQWECRWEIGSHPLATHQVKVSLGLGLKTSTKNP